MGFGQAIKTCFTKYGTFDGRARRAEFWLFYLFTQFVGIMGLGVMFITAIAVLPMSEGAGDPSGAALAVFFVVMTLVILASVALIVPIYAAWARRLHDMGQSGHWLWLNFVGFGIVPLVMSFIDSQQGPNRWGPDPKAAERGQVGGYGQQYGGQPYPGQPYQGQPYPQQPPAANQPPAGYQPPAGPPPSGNQPPTGFLPPQ